VFVTFVIWKKPFPSGFYKKKMSLAYIIPAVVILHFVVGIAYLIYKINTAKPNDDCSK
jgi:hypothetical protein